MKRRPGSVARVRVAEWQNDFVTKHEDHIATEEPLELRVFGPDACARRFGVTMRTPGNDFELAAGLLYSEGVLGGRDDIESIAYCTDASVRDDQKFNVVTMSMAVPPRVEWADARMSATSACGVCGADSIDDVIRLADAGRATDRPVSQALLGSLPDLLRSRQPIFDRTGGLHAAGMFDAAGAALVAREDIGRHNAVDKAIGHQLLGGNSMAGTLLCTSGRLGFEIVQKAVMAGCAAVVAVGAPSSLAVSLAQRAGLTAAGFARSGRMVVYAGETGERSGNLLDQK